MLSARRVAVSRIASQSLPRPLPVLILQLASREPPSSGRGKASAALPKQTPKTATNIIRLGNNILRATVELKFATELLYTIHFWWHTQSWLIANRIIPPFLRSVKLWAWKVLGRDAAGSRWREDFWLIWFHDRFRRVQMKELSDNPVLNIYFPKFWNVTTIVAN